MQDLRGHFSDLPLPKLLSWLKNNQINGFLRISSAGRRKEFLVRRGETVSFRSNDPQEQLEAVLAQNGIAELSFLTELRKKCRKEKKSFVDVLLERELLPKKELRLWLRQSLLLALDNALSWSEGHFMFRFATMDRNARDTVVASAPLKSAAPPPEIEEILNEEKIFTKINEKIVTGDIELPPMPDTLLKVRQCLNQPDWDSQDLLKIIMTDQLLTTSILKAANSSRYGLSSRVSSLQHAIVLMGMKTIWGIVTHQSLLGSFSKERERIQDVLDHSFLCALIARQIASICKFDEEDAFTCALLHDIGKAVMFNQLSGLEITAEKKERLVARFHTEAGLLIAAKWNLPDLVLETIEHHHQPENAETNVPLVEIVCLADCLAHHRNPNDELGDRLRSLDLEQLDLADLLDKTIQIEKSLAATAE